MLYVHSYQAHRLCPHIMYTELEITIGRPFLKSRNIAIDYQWFPHWKFTVHHVWPSKSDLLNQMGKLVEKWPKLLFQALYVYSKLVITGS